MYYSLLTNYSSHVAFDEALALLNWLKRNCQNYERKSILQKQQPLDNILFEMLNSSKSLATVASVKLLLVRMIFYHMCVLFHFSCLLHWWTRTPVAFKMELFVTKKNNRWKLLLLLQGVLSSKQQGPSLPLKSMDKLRQRQYHIFSVFWVSLILSYSIILCLIII